MEPSTQPLFSDLEFLFFFVSAKPNEQPGLLEVFVFFCRGTDKPGEDSNPISCMHDVMFSLLFCRPRGEKTPTAPPLSLLFRQVGVIALPEVTEYVLKPEDEFLVLASDGVWEFIDNQEVGVGEYKIGFRMC